MRSFSSLPAAVATPGNSGLIPFDSKRESLIADLTNYIKQRKERTEIGEIVFPLPAPAKTNEIKKKSRASRRRIPVFSSQASHGLSLAGRMPHCAIQRAILAVLENRAMSPNEIAVEVSKQGHVDVSQKSVGIAIFELTQSAYIKMVGPALYAKAG
ncbi:MAG: hypothetical protein NTX50_02430 [Candidatus Sumerlaeota bacterium]|nr:hypothetical protein [Candidatus Sumerlaeota bacterium]